MALFAVCRTNIVVVVWPMLEAPYMVMCSALHTHGRSYGRRPMVMDHELLHRQRRWYPSPMPPLILGCLEQFTATCR